VVPDRLGRFVILAKLGEGGMGLIYQAKDPSLDRDVAIKVLSPRHGDTDHRERLLREAQAMGRVAHPNVVSVYEVGADEGILFIAMELVQGETLGEWLKREPRGYAATIDKFVQAGKGLAAAHRAGILHRDFKPANVIVGVDGRARVLDFGLARYVHEDSGRAVVPISSSSPLASPLTQFGELLGTPAYMSPEHFRGEVSAASDQWSFCVAVYRALFRRQPFEAESPKELYERIRSEDPLLPDPGDVPAAIVDIGTRTSRRRRPRTPPRPTSSSIASRSSRAIAPLNPFVHRARSDLLGVPRLAHFGDTRSWPRVRKGTNDSFAPRWNELFAGLRTANDSFHLGAPPSKRAYPTKRGNCNGCLTTYDAASRRHRDCERESSCSDPRKP
jgi:serine/threonine protein kinase